MPKDEGKLRLLNPLNIRFSQPRIAPHFRDGHLLHETAAEVRTVPLEDNPALERAPDSAEGVPPYDLVILPPFPCIRVISWLPKLRGSDGEAERDANGDQILGKRAWFVLDNRRLQTLQTAAAKAWPRRCCAVVRCLEEVPGTTIRELRKFRTTTEGRSIEVGVRVGDAYPWSWVQDAPAGARAEELVAEGPFAEDLWDAERWAPQAVAATASGNSLEDAPESEPAHREPQPPRPAPKAAAVRQTEPQRRNSHGGYAGRAQVAPQPPAYAGFGGYPPAWPVPGGGFNHLDIGGLADIGGVFNQGRQLAACPENGWEYIDPSGTVRGPFELAKMRLWHQHGFFFPHLPMRCTPEDGFVPFKDLFPAPAEPFKSCVTRYKFQ